MGSFYTRDNIPYFSPEQGIEYQLKTSQNVGLEIKIESSPRELDPDIYYNFGTVSGKVVISRLNSRIRTHVETYEGEFTVVEGGSVVFPSQVKWVETPDFSESGYLYQFRIYNGIGTFHKIKL